MTKTRIRELIQLSNGLQAIRECREDGWSFNESKAMVAYCALEMAHVNGDHNGRVHSDCPVCNPKITSIQDVNVSGRFAGMKS